MGPVATAVLVCVMFATFLAVMGLLVSKTMEARALRRRIEEEARRNRVRRLQAERGGRPHYAAYPVFSQRKRSERSGSSATPPSDHRTVLDYDYGLSSFDYDGDSSFDTFGGGGNFGGGGGSI